jgi:urea transport system permease protein
MRRCTHCHRALALAFALLLAGVHAAFAQGYEKALEKFTADSYSDTDAAVAGVAASGNPLAAEVIEALQAGNLLFSAAAKKVYIRKPPASLRDAATGQPVSGP